LKLDILENLLIDIYAGKYSPKGKFTTLRKTNINHYVDILIQSEVKEKDLIIPFETMTEYPSKSEYFKYECFNYKFEDIERLKMLAFAYSLEVPILKKLLEEEYELRLKEFISNTPEKLIEDIKKSLNVIIHSFYRYKPNMSLLDIANFCYKSESCLTSILDPYLKKINFDFWTSSYVYTILKNEYMGLNKGDFKYLSKSSTNYYMFKGELDWFPNFYNTKEFLKIYKKELKKYKKNFHRECAYFNPNFVNQIR